MYIPHIHSVTDEIDVIRIYNLYNIISWNIIALSDIYFNYLSLLHIVCALSTYFHSEKKWSWKSLFDFIFQMRFHYIRLNNFLI